MKTPLILAVVLLGQFISPKLLAQGSWTSQKSLHCFLRDENRRRVMDERFVQYQNGNKILFLMGTSEIAGYVTDVQGASADDRHLQLEMRYQVGSEWGVAQTSVDYKISDAPKNLASLSLQEPTVWAHVITLKCELVSR
ncbi:MAG: hypothetical protein BroJett040_04140 [Oligoflexia bacterium]|nr:MAG: hypothetical protein BroJett040_04140 [Oligoflexia bacterium]